MKTMVKLILSIFGSYSSVFFFYLLLIERYKHHVYDKWKM